MRLYMRLRNNELTNNNVKNMPDTVHCLPSIMIEGEKNPLFIHEDFAEKMEKLKKRSPGKYKKLQAKYKNLTTMILRKSSEHNVFYNLCNPDLVPVENETVVGTFNWDTATLEQEMEGELPKAFRPSWEKEE
jgi:hypothetical protein